MNTFVLGFFLGFWFPSSVDVSPEVMPIKGITVSCQGYGRVWGTDSFAKELDRLVALGANSVTIHPYARIHDNGAVSWRSWEGGEPPAYLTRPILEAHARGLEIMIKPHLAYWGSRFSWRGEIAFEEPEERERFFATYQQWIVAIAAATRDADIFSVGTELKLKTGDEQAWRDIIAAVRKVTQAKLTYAANWDAYESVGFWEALDYIGIQGYFPLTTVADPSEEDLVQAWETVLARVRRVHRAADRPVIFTEFGYNQSTLAASKPWDYKEEHTQRAETLQARCLQVGLEVINREKRWLHGAFLWKWFAGPAPRANFRLNTPRLRAIISEAWLPSP